MPPIGSRVDRLALGKRILDPVPYRSIPRKVVKTMNPKQLRRLMEQAQAMQEKMESALTSMRVEGVSGGGAVRVVLNGKKELQEVQLAREAVDPDDVEMLQDLILAAYQDGLRQVDEQTQTQLQALGNLAGNLAGK
jgi:hypothetical protein